MAKIITETIEGLDLFSGGTDDGFEIVTGGMPNGDNSLRVRGDLDQNIRAFADVSGTTTPDITAPTFSVAYGGTIVMWLKLDSLSGVDLGTPDTENCIMTVQSSNAPVQNALQEHNSTTFTSWKICAGGVDGLLIRYGTSWKSSGGTKQWRGSSKTLTIGTWHMLAFSHGSSSVGNNGGVSSLDGAPFGGPFEGGSRSTSSGVSSAVNLAIGSVSTVANVGVRPGAWEIGKVSFHSGQLSSDNLAELYSFMGS